MVWMRAIVFRISRVRAVAVSLPTASWKRRSRHSSCNSRILIFELLDGQRAQLGGFTPTTSRASTSATAPAAAHAGRAPARQSGRPSASFIAARASASAARSFGTPAISKRNAPRLDDRHPELRVPLPRPHPRLGRLLRHRLVGKIRIQTLPPRFRLLVIAAPGRLDLAAADPGRLQCLEPNSPKAIAAPCALPSSGPHHLAVLSSASASTSCAPLRSGAIAFGSAIR
jgi:hypothetical protein